VYNALTDATGLPIMKASESMTMKASESKEILSELANKYPDTWKQTLELLAMLQDIGLEGYKLNASEENPIVAQFSIN
jgi:hypothetical protein